jgi:hypothetical protein
MLNNSTKRLYALGRLKSGERNKTEAAYELELEKQKQAGMIQWYVFEGIKFRLADNCFYSPDFAVLLANGEMEMHEVKGAKAIFMDDSKAKIKVASAMYPFRFIAAFPIPKKNGGGWEIQEF